MANSGRLSELVKVAVSKGFMAATETWVIAHFAAWVAVGVSAFFLPHRDLPIFGSMFHVEIVGVAGLVVSVWYIYATLSCSPNKQRDKKRIVPLLLISAMLGMMALAYLLVSDDVHAMAQTVIVWIMSLYLMSVKLRNSSFADKVSADIKKKI